jgi:Immunoglobulin-like domain of bacterial spore germination/Sporulation and spore germination
VKRALQLGVAVVGALLIAGCGDDATSETTTTSAAETTTARVYFLHDGKVWPVARDVEGEVPMTSVLDELFNGPNEQEQSDLGIKTAIGAGAGFDDFDFVVEGSVARVNGVSGLSTAGLAQLVYTITQFRGVKSAEIEGKSYTRADFEDQTPAILVESPLPFEDVTSPIRATGTANTFEATFNYELTDSDGRIVDENFVTATSGTGTRGTFDFTTKPFTVPFDGVGSLVVFERSAEDGSRTKLVEIPLQMSQ